MEYMYHSELLFIFYIFGNIFCLNYEMKYVKFCRGNYFFFFFIKHIIIKQPFLSTLSFSKVTFVFSLRISCNSNSSSFGCQKNLKDWMSSFEKWAQYYSPSDKPKVLWLLYSIGRAITCLTIKIIWLMLL